MSKRNSLLGSEGGTWNKDDPVLQDRCLVLNGEVGISRLEDVGESVLGEGTQKKKVNLSMFKLRKLVWIQDFISRVD